MLLSKTKQRQFLEKEHFFEVQNQFKSNTKLVKKIIDNEQNEQDDFNCIKKVKTGKWTARQLGQYVRHIQANLGQFKDSNLRRKRKVFNRMSKRVRTRTSSQCRSHHQKVMKKFFTLQRALASIKAQFGTDEQFIGGSYIKSKANKLLKPSDAQAPNICNKNELSEQFRSVKPGIISYWGDFFEKQIWLEKQRNELSAATKQTEREMLMVFDQQKQKQVDLFNLLLK